MIFNLRFTNKQKGFTLIELLVVIAVIGVLAGAVMFAIDPVSQIGKANDAKRKSDLAQIQKALEQFYNDNGSYPVATAGYNITSGNFGNSWNPYMAKVPQDPRNPTKTYVYVTDATRQTYWLYTSLDNKKDPQVCTQVCAATGKAACPNACANNVSNKCGSGNGCDFGVSSSNSTP